MGSEHGYTIRQATLDDLDQVYEVWLQGVAQSLGGAPDPAVDHRARFRRQIEEQDDDFKLFVAIDDEGVVGWQALAPFRANPAVRGLFAESSTYVRTTNARAGVGRDLIFHALGHADRSRLQFVVAYVAITNERTLYSAQKAGFTLVGTLPSAQKPPAGPPLAFLVYACGGWSA